MGDWIGLAFFVLFLVIVLFAIRMLANPRPRTSEEFEKNAVDNPTAIGAFMNALHEVTDPSATKAKEVRMQMKEGRFQKKKREGKSGGNAGTERHGDAETSESEI